MTSTPIVTGLTADQLKATVGVLGERAGKSTGDNAARVLENILRAAEK